MEIRGASLFFLGTRTCVSVLHYLLESNRTRYNLPCIPIADVGDPGSQFLFWLHWDLSRQHITYGL